MTYKPRSLLGLVLSNHTTQYTVVFTKNDKDVRSLFILSIRLLLDELQGDVDSYGPFITDGITLPAPNTSHIA